MLKGRHLDLNVDISIIEVDIRYSLKVDIPIAIKVDITYLKVFPLP